MRDGTTEGAPVVAIFRQNLFRISEPFVTDQAGALVRHRPVHLGRARFGPAPAGSVSLALTDPGTWRSRARIARHMATRDARPFLDRLGAIRPSLVHAHFGTDAAMALPLAQALGVGLVTTFHGFDATLSRARMLASPAWFHFGLSRGRLARGGALFLCVSAFIRDRVLAMGFPPDRTLVHHTGIDVDAIAPRDPAEETRTILHVARLVEMKGTEYLLRAFARLPSAHRDVTLAIVGDGDRRRALERLARALGLGDRVRFLGARPHHEVLGHVRRAAMLVLPSVRTASGRVEGLGMVLLEAAASGVAVVASDVGGIGEGVQDGRTGLLVPPREPDALAAAIACLLDAPETRRRMGTEARAFVASRFDLARQTARLEALYDEVRAARFCEVAGAGAMRPARAPPWPERSSDVAPFD